MYAQYCGAGVVGYAKLWAASTHKNGVRGVSAGTRAGASLRVPSA